MGQIGDAGRESGPDADRVVFALQWGGRTSQNSQGSGWGIDVSFTLNAVDVHAVYYDARGNGNGSVAPTITGDHQNRITDYTAIVVEHDRTEQQPEPRDGV